MSSNIASEKIKSLRGPRLGKDALHSGLESSPTKIRRMIGKISCFLKHRKVSVITFAIFFGCFLKQNRKHFLCVYRAIETLVEV